MEFVEIVGPCEKCGSKAIAKISARGGEVDGVVWKYCMVCKFNKRVQDVEPSEAGA